MRLHAWGRRLARCAAHAVRAAGFTPGEQRLVLFLVVAFLAGFGLKMLGVGERPAPLVDYRQLDSEFAARSRLPDSAALIPDTGSGGHSTGGPAVRKDRIDLNRARRQELMTLPGIGPALADRIVAYRTEVSPFASVGDLLKVKGIGRKKLEQIAPLCTVNE